MLSFFGRDCYCYGRIFYIFRILDWGRFDGSYLDDCFYIFLEFLSIGFE